jgi:hypothetical protein
MKGRSRFRRISQSTPAALSFSDEIPPSAADFAGWHDVARLHPERLEVEATLPNDVVRFLAGWYLLFALVDRRRILPSLSRTTNQSHRL